MGLTTPLPVTSNPHPQTKATNKQTKQKHPNLLFKTHFPDPHDVYSLDRCITPTMLRAKI